MQRCEWLLVEQAAEPASHSEQEEHGAEDRGDGVPVALGVLEGGELVESGNIHKVAGESGIVAHVLHHAPHLQVAVGVVLVVSPLHVAGADAEPEGHLGGGAGAVAVEDQSGITKVGVCGSGDSGGIAIDTSLEATTVALPQGARVSVADTIGVVLDANDIILANGFNHDLNLSVVSVGDFDANGVNVVRVDLQSSTTNGVDKAERITIRQCTSIPTPLRRGDSRPSICVYTWILNICGSSLQKAKHKND